MDDKTKTPTQAEPSLFDGLEPQEPTAQEPTQAGGTPQVIDTRPGTTEEWAETMRKVEERRREYERAGVWAVWPPETLLRRAEVFYNQRVTTVINTMTAAGATVDVVNAVCNDYIGVLSGTCKYTATVEQIKAALHTLQPSTAFSIDRYGLYFGLFLNYMRFLLVYDDYEFTVKGIHATDKTKRVYLSEFYPPMDARAVRWLLDRGYFQASDFSGFEPSEMGEYFARINAYAELGEYVLYYTVARLALLATPDELAQVAPPPHTLKAQTNITDFCEDVVRQTVAQLEQAAAKFGEALTSDTPTEQAQARQAGRDWRDDTNRQPVKIHENYGIILSRPVNVSPHGQQVVTTQPVQQYIDRFRASNPQYGLITEMTVQKVFEGVNLLPSYLSGSMKRDERGRLVFNTNISEFAEICGYADANQDEKKALLGGLLLLSNLYFVVDKPKKYTERVNAKGKTVRKHTGGRVALQFLNVPEIGVDTGELIIEVTPESLQGRPTLITPDTYKQLRAESKGLTQSRFNAQIETKSHKSELDLIDEVFGFADMLKYATDEDRPRIVKYIQGHRGRERKRVLGWFARYVEAGIITDFKREPSKTRRGDFVLSWHCPDPSKLTPPPFREPDTQEPDEQAQQ